MIQRHSSTTQYKFRNLLKWTTKDVLVSYRPGNPMSREGGNQKYSSYHQRRSRSDFRRKRIAPLKDNTPQLFKRNRNTIAKIKRESKPRKKKRFREMRSAEKLLTSFEKVVTGSICKKPRHKRKQPGNKHVKRRMKVIRQRKMISHLYDNKHFGISKTRNYLGARNKINPLFRYAKPRTNHMMQTWNMEKRLVSSQYKLQRPKFGKKKFSRVDKEVKPFLF